MLAQWTNSPCVDALSRFLPRGSQDDRNDEDADDEKVECVENAMTTSAASTKLHQRSNVWPLSIVSSLKPKSVVDTN